MVVLIIFFVILQTFIIVIMLSIGGQEKVPSYPLSAGKRGGEGRGGQGRLARCEVGGREQRLSWVNTFPQTVIDMTGRASQLQCPWRSSCIDRVRQTDRQTEIGTKRQGHVQAVGRTDGRSVGWSHSIIMNDLEPWNARIRPTNKSAVPAPICVPCSCSGSCNKYLLCNGSRHLARCITSAAVWH